MIPETAGGWAGWVFAVAGIMFGWLQHTRRAKIDETAGALHMWEGLAKAHTAQIEALTTRLTKAEKEIAQLRLDHADELAQMKKLHAADLASRDDQIAGLVRMIAQNSQSTAFRMGDPDGTAITKASRKARGDDE
jgi:chromosome segregation ATPase